MIILLNDTILNNKLMSQKLISNILKPSLLVIIFLMFSLFCIKSIEKGNRAFLSCFFKNNTNSNAEEIFKYFEEINSIFDKAKKTEYTTSQSLFGVSPPEKAIQLLDDLMAQARNIKAPQVCLEHYILTMKFLESLKAYHSERKELGDNGFKLKRDKDNAYEEKIRNEKINRLILEEKRQKIYFKILNNIREKRGSLTHSAFDGH